MMGNVKLLLAVPCFRREQFRNLLKGSGFELHFVGNLPVWRASGLYPRYIVDLEFDSDPEAALQLGLELAGRGKKVVFICSSIPDASSPANVLFLTKRESRSPGVAERILSFFA